MSKAKASDDSKAPLKPVALPSLPKYDDNNRNRWAAEYDKVEAELLKTHVSAPNCQTTTLGLRLLPANFDRTIPSMEPESTSTMNHRSPKRAKTSLDNRSDTSKRFGRLSPIPSRSPGRSPIRRPSSVTPAHNVTTSLSNVQGLCKTGIDIAQTLMTLADPPVQFRTSFTIDKKSLNLNWLKSYSPTQQTPNFNTLETVREDLIVNPSARDDTSALSSPRSIIILLRNGLSMDDLQIRPLSHFSNPSTSQETALAAHRHHEERRKALLIALRDEYREFCNHVSTNDILDGLLTLRGKDHAASSSTMIQKGKERMIHVQEANKEKLQKQMEYIDQTKKRIAEAEMRRLHSEDEAKERQRQKRELSKQRALEAAKRMQELQEGTKHLQIDFLMKVEERKKKLEEKERAREAQLEAQKERLRQETERKALIRKERLEQKRAAQEAHLRQQEETFFEKESAAAQRRAAHEAEKAELKEKIRQQQLLANQRREEAREHARLHEQAERDAAERKRQHAEEKLRSYFETREKQREELHKLEKEKERQREEKRRLAEMQSEEKKHNILSKLEHHESILREGRERMMEVEAIHHELQKFSQEDKSFFVTRKSKGMEFQKLLAVADIERKREKAESIARERESLLHATLADREAQRLQQENFKREIEMKLHAM